MTAEQALTDVRSVEILDSIKVIFANKGFDGASMQDLARAAKMSAGNFYRYFPSKNAIIEALIEREIAMVREEFGAVIRSPDPRAAFASIVRERVASDDVCDGSIWAEIEASAARRPEIAVLLGRMEAEVTRNLLAVFSRIAALSEAEAGRRFGAHARFIVLLVQGMSTRSTVTAPGAPVGPDHELAALVVQTIERVLAEISGAENSSSGSHHAYS